jgi:Homing endonuclease associated repeat
MTKEAITSAIVKCAEKLGRVPSFTEVERTCKVTASGIRKHFGKYSWALRECKLRTDGDSRKAEMPELFRDWATVTRDLKKLPSVLEYAHLGKYSESPLRVRFGSWNQVPHGLKLYAEGHGLAEEWKDVLELIAAQDKKKTERAMLQGPTQESLQEASQDSRVLIDRPMYGPPMWPCPLAHCPTNEMGVVYLFGSLAAGLGFMVLRLQIEFPDCEAMRRVEGGRWQWVRIEFEHESRNFLRHMHDASKCDLIVCWEHNWPECPLEVLELRRVVGNQPSAFSNQPRPTPLKREGTEEAE